MGHHEQAVADFSAVLQQEPANISALYNRGAAYDLLDQHDLAVSDLMQAMEIEAGATDSMQC